MELHSFIDLLFELQVHDCQSQEAVLSTPRLEFNPVHQDNKDKVLSHSFWYLDLGFLELVTIGN